MSPKLNSGNPVWMKGCPCRMVQGSKEQRLSSFKLYGAVSAAIALEQPNPSGRTAWHLDCIHRIALQERHFKVSVFSEDKSEHRYSTGWFYKAAIPKPWLENEFNKDRQPLAAMGFRTLYRVPTITSLFSTFCNPGRIQLNCFGSTVCALTMPLNNRPWCLHAGSQKLLKSDFIWRQIPLCENSHKRCTPGCLSYRQCVPVTASWLFKQQRKHHASAVL